MITETLKFRLADGRPTVEEAELDETEFRTGDFLVARNVMLTDGERELRQHRALSGRDPADGYEQLDNEILAGRRLAEAARRRGYPPELARLHGDDADGADPYVLFDRYRGRPLSEAVQSMPGDEQEKFRVSLLNGLCWLAAVGIAHRGIGPDTVWWDGRRAQIVDFSRCTVFGVTRTPVRGFPAWVPKEQQPGTANGTVGPRDDTWAAAQLIFYAHTEGQECPDPDELAASDLDGLLAQVLMRALGPLTARPTAAELLTELRGSDPAPRGFSGNVSLREGRAGFLTARDLKRPDEPVPPDFYQDLDWAPDASSPGPPPVAADPVLDVFPGSAVPLTGGLPDTDGGLTGSAGPEPQAYQPTPGQSQARGRKKGFFGRRRDDG